MYAMLCQIFSDITNWYSFKTDFSFSQTNDFSQAIKAWICNMLKGGKNENFRVASPESIPIRLEKNHYSNSWRRICPNTTYATDSKARLYPCCFYSHTFSMLKITISITTPSKIKSKDKCFPLKQLVWTFIKAISVVLKTRRGLEII